MFGTTKVRKKNNMNKIQAIFFDVDGTLLDFETHTLSQSTVDALNALRSSGIKIALATNRSLKEVLEIPKIDQIEWDGYVISAGGEVRNKEREIVYKTIFANSNLKKIFEIANENRIPVYYFQQSGKLTRKNQYTDEFVDHYGMKEVGVYPWNGLMAGMVTLIDPDIERLRQLTSDIPGIRSMKSCAVALDIFPKYAQKANGVSHLMKYWELDRYAAFGDSENDNQMLKNAELSFAMPWASDSTKSIADRVMENYGEHSIAHALKKEDLIA